MEYNYQNDVRIFIGKSQGDASAETIAQWQAIVNMPIQVHVHPASGVKTYLINDFPEGVEAEPFAKALQEAGISDAHLVHLVDGQKLRYGWDNYHEIGPEQAVI